MSSIVLKVPSNFFRFDKNGKIIDSSLNRNGSKV